MTSLAFTPRAFAPRLVAPSSRGLSPPACSPPRLYYAVPRHAAPCRVLHPRLVPVACLPSPSDSDFVPIAAPFEAPASGASSLESDASVDLAASGFPPSGSDSGASGGSGGGDSDGRGGEGSDGDTSDDKQLASLLKESNASLADVPADILASFRGQIIPLSAIANYLVARANPLSRMMLSVPALRVRFLADRLFLLKILIEEGIGIFGKLSAEYQQRRSRFWTEGEFVLSNLLIAMLADFALVYLPAPTVSLSKSDPNATKGFLQALSRMTSDLPTNIFQTNRPFTLGQRTAGFFLKFGQLFAVGVACSFLGVMLSNTFITVREKLDPKYETVCTKQDPFAVSLLYGLFLGASSGTRYQLVNGVESHLFPVIFKSTPRILEEVATFGLRYANTFWGSQQWVMFTRYTNVQKVKDL